MYIRNLNIFIIIYRSLDIYILCVSSFAHFHMVHFQWLERLSKDNRFRGSILVRDNLFKELLLISVPITTDNRMVKLPDFGLLMTPDNLLSVGFATDVADVFFGSIYYRF